MREKAGNQPLSHCVIPSQRGRTSGDVMKTIIQEILSYHIDKEDADSKRIHDLESECNLLRIECNYWKQKYQQLHNDSTDTTHKNGTYNNVVHNNITVNNKGSINSNSNKNECNALVDIFIQEIECLSAAMKSKFHNYKSVVSSIDENIAMNAKHAPTLFKTILSLLWSRDQSNKSSSRHIY